MANFNGILDVLEGDDSAAELCPVGDSLAGWEDVLEDLNNALAKARIETLEDEMRVRFGNGAAGAIWNIVTEDDVVEGERCGWAVWEVR